jgi:hypothetical protein
MKSTIWTDTDSNFGVGDVGFLVEVYRLNNHSREHYTLRDTPACKNMSGEETFEGWCGTTNDVDVNAHGLGRVVRVAQNGRIQIERVTDEAEIVAGLDTLGYPDIR